MRKFKGYISTGTLGGTRKFDFEVEDGATEEEIREEAWESAQNYIDFGYEEVAGEEGE